MIGQYGSSNYNIYRMYFITNKSKIGYYDGVGEIDISGKQYSPILETNKDGDIVYNYYDNMKSKIVEKTIDIDLLKAK